MHSEPQPYPQIGDDGDLTSYFAHAVERAKRYYKMFLVLLGIFTILVVTYAHVATPVYRAVAALTPPKDALLDASGLTNVSGGIASISRRLGLGGAPAGSNYDLFDEYTRVLASYRLADALADRTDFMTLAFSKHWDPQTRHLKKRSGTMAVVIDSMKYVLGLPSTNASDVDQVYKLLTQNLSISTPHDPTTNISEISFRFDNAAAAQKILDVILAEADSLMRADKREDITARIAYLKDQLGKVTLEDQKTSLISLLAIQQNTMMIISADHRYASYVVEPPHTPQKPAWPNAGSILGLILFLTFVFWGAAICFLPARWLERLSLDKKSL